MAEYTLINHATDEHHELDFENVSDIQNALGEIHDFNNKIGKYAPGSTFPIDQNKIFTWECFEDTRKKMSKVTVPDTDY